VERRPREPGNRIGVQRDRCTKLRASMVIARGNRMLCVGVSGWCDAMRCRWQLCVSASASPLARPDVQTCMLVFVRVNRRHRDRLLRRLHVASGAHLLRSRGAWAWGFGEVGKTCLVTQALTGVPLGKSCTCLRGREHEQNIDRTVVEISQGAF